MRGAVAIVAALVVIMALLMAALYNGNSKPEAQLHNAYWPFSVETSIYDR